MVATDDPANLAEATRVLKVTVQRDIENPDAWYNLGLVYSRMGDEPRAQLATAEQLSLDGKPAQAASSAEMAMRGLPTGTPDWLRAQDIALSASDEAKRMRKNRH